MVEAGEDVARLAPGGLLVVTVMECQGLRSMDLLNGLANPFVSLRVGKQERHTSTRPQTLNPQWNPPESFEFVIEDSSMLEIDVYQHTNLLVEGARTAVSLLTLQTRRINDSVDLMGSAEVSLAGLATSRAIDREIHLSHAGSISISLQFFTWA